MDPLPTLAAARLRLRPLAAADVPALFRLFAEPRVMRYWSSPPLADLAAAREMYEDIAKLGRKDVLYQWGIAGDEDYHLGGEIQNSAILGLLRPEWAAAVR